MSVHRSVRRIQRCAVNVVGGSGGVVVVEDLVGFAASALRLKTAQSRACCCLTTSLLLRKTSRVGQVLVERVQPPGGSGPIFSFAFRERRCVPVEVGLDLIIIWALPECNHFAGNQLDVELHPSPVLPRQLVLHIVTNWLKMNPIPVGVPGGQPMSQR